MAIHHQENLTKLAGMHGIITAGSVVGGTGVMSIQGDSAHHNLLRDVVGLFNLVDSETRKKPIRATVGDLTILAVDFGHERAGVVFPTGHEVAKSVQRSMRRMSRKAPKPSPEGADQG